MLNMDKKVQLSYLKKSQINEKAQAKCKVKYKKSVQTFFESNEKCN